MSAAAFAIGADFIADHNARREGAVTEDYHALSRALERRGFDAEELVKKVMAFGVAVPTWGVGTGGTRFARFPGPGEPRNVFEKIDDCGAIQQLARATAPHNLPPARSSARHFRLAGNPRRWKSRSCTSPDDWRLIV